MSIRLSHRITLGVLDIQGSVEEHLAVLAGMVFRDQSEQAASIKIPAIGVKTKQDLEKVSGLIIPGGESTTISKLLKLYELDEVIKKRTKAQTLCVWGTCAGAILLAKHVLNRPPPTLQLMDITIERNAYGSQLDSFETELSVPALGAKKIPAVFIRAPQVKTASPNVQVLAEYDGHPVMLRQENLLATMFHPELTGDTRVHQYFFEMTQSYEQK
ncbi:MAG: pyridoxal 5'-phosphate synthase glutaminase subunit PdxT [Patescibacteria group bacterium]